MSDLYVVYFDVHGEPASAQFEYQTNAIALADHVADAEFSAGGATVVDEFGLPRDERTVIHDTEDEEEVDAK